MTNLSFHKDFKLNGNSFSTVNELLSFSDDMSDEFSFFLRDWFTESNTISVQTSGSTGSPKLILLEKQQMINSALATGFFFNLREKTQSLLCLPIEYIAGKMMLVRALTLGWHLDLVNSSSNPLKDVSKEYDFSAMVPLQLENSINKLHQIKKLIVGGGVVSNQLQEKLQPLESEIFATYGMTETITHIAIKKLNNFAVYPNFYNTLPSIQIYKDERNCLVIRAPKVSNDVVFTNDVVALVSDTEFEWLGRFDNVINSGGVKLHPEKIEKKLSKIIKERFFVAGIPHKKLGQQLILIIEGKKSEINFNDANLLKYETPKQIFFIDRFVETETKKIQRKKTLNLVEF